MCTCDDSSVLPATGYMHRMVVLQPEFTGHVVCKAAPSKCEDGSCFFKIKKVLMSQKLYK